LLERRGVRTANPMPSPERNERLGTRGRSSAGRLMSSGIGVPGAMTIASASCSRPASQYRRAGVTERFFNHCERSPRAVLARIR
jgi:hypothetical protein